MGIRQFPHCDQRILHAPKGYVDDGALVSQSGEKWLLAILPTGEAPWLPERERTSVVSHARTVTPRFAIRLTQPAWSALLSKATTIGSNGSEQIQNRVSVASVALPIVHGSAQLVSALGDLLIQTQLASGANWQPGNESESLNAGHSFVNNDQSPAWIVTPVFLGTSWNLTIDRDGVTRTLRLPDFSAPALSRESRLNWLSAISSVLTAIGPGLTSEQWQKENERLSKGECEYCDGHGEWQELRLAWGIAFTGHRPESGLSVSGYPSPAQLPCPADFNRPPDSRSDHRRWAGNKPTSADGDASWPMETVASRMMYGDHGGRQPWSFVERLRTRFLEWW